MMIHLTFKRITFNKSILGTHKTNKLKGGSSGIQKKEAVATITTHQLNKQLISKPFISFLSLCLGRVRNYEGR